ncbi:hypothetical protein [Microbacterium arborescens]|uniref:hypothetical protein n=1 Tax=Microbacterium arborescens TaxID=33883 RepID=UPI003C75B0D4
MRPAKPVIVHIIWAVAGFAAGAAVALLWVWRFDANWVGATGTWFGAIATVLTLLWAVQTFRADQTRREVERADQEAARVQAAVDERREVEEAERRSQAAAVEQANRVTVAVFPNGASGRNNDMNVDSVVLRITNESRERIMFKSFKLGGPLLSRAALAEPIGIDANDTHRLTVRVARVRVSDREASGREPIARFVAEITYTVAGQTWTRSSVAPARLIRPENEGPES